MVQLSQVNHFKETLKSVPGCPVQGPWNPHHYLGGEPGGYMGSTVCNGAKFREYRMLPCQHMGVTDRRLVCRRMQGKASTGRDGWGNK